MTAPLRAVSLLLFLAILTLGGGVLALSSTFTPSAQAQDGSVPARPTGLTAEASQDSVRLTWNDSDDDRITYFQVLRRDRDIHDADEFVTIEDDTGSADTAYIDDTVEPEKSYVYRVKAVNRHGVSEWSKYARADTPAAPPPEPDPTPAPTPDSTPGSMPRTAATATATPTLEPEEEPSPGALAPTGLTANAAKDGGVTLRWTAPAEDSGSVTGYEVLRAKGRGGQTTLEADTGSAGTAYTDRTATEAGQTYAYQIKALRGQEKSRGVQPGRGGNPRGKGRSGERRARSEGRPPSEDGIYTWQDGERTMRVRLEPGTSTPRSGGGDAKGVRGLDPGGDSEPVFRSEPDGGLMTLPGGVLLVLDPSWSDSDADRFFSSNGIRAGRVTELNFAENAYFVETEPGFSSLQLANSLAAQKGVEIASPNWKGELITTDQGVPEDDHGDTIETATELPLNTRIEATLHTREDVDVFKIELLEPAYVLIAQIDSDNAIRDIVFFTVLDSTGAELPEEITGELRNHTRSLDAGVYYLRAHANRSLWHLLVQSSYQYNVQVRVIPDHGDTFDSATTLNLMPEYDPLGEWDLDYRLVGDFHSSEDVDFFKVELSADAEVEIEVNFPFVQLTSSFGAFVPVNVDAFDEDYNPLHPPIPGLTGNFKRPYRLEVGTYYFRLSLHPGYYETLTSAEELTTYYGVILYGNTEYVEFIDRCTNIETTFGDPLLGCQDHLSNADAEGLDINVEEVWATNKGEGINIVVVDEGIEGSHEDLRDNVYEALNYDYNEEGQVTDPRYNHGTSVAGIIAARDNGLGVRGVAPRAKVYSHNLLINSTALNTVDALTRSMGVTAISNNSYGRSSRGLPKQESQTMTTALETGISQGFNGKGVFYVFAGGNEDLDGAHANLREAQNFYAVTAVCVVDSDGKRVWYSETGYALWLCAPPAEVTTDNRNRYRYDFSGSSSGASVVSGVAALVRSANTSLTWRDVKLILAASARQTDPDNSEWKEGALKYNSETEWYLYNPEYGFGVVDAKAAVDLAESWVNLPSMKSNSVDSGEIDLTIPDPTGDGDPTTVTRGLFLKGDVGFTEFVEVTVDFDHPSSETWR